MYMCIGMQMYAYMCVCMYMHVRIMYRNMYISWYIHVLARMITTNIPVLLVIMSTVTIYNTCVPVITNYSCYSSAQKKF